MVEILTGVGLESYKECDDLPTLGVGEPLSFHPHPPWPAGVRRGGGCMSLWRDLGLPGESWFPSRLGM